nr:MAG TPA: hypothetical protein [Caudoviricetes sp.]
MINYFISANHSYSPILLLVIIVKKYDICNIIIL